MLEMRTSERGMLKRCVQQWHWSIVEGLEPNRSANPLWFGSAVHEGLAAWYRPHLERGPHPAETFAAFLEGNRSMLVNSDEEEMQWVDARALGIDMLNRYVEHWGQDDRWDVIATEKTFRVTMARPARRIFGIDIPALQRWLRYVGTWDGVYIDLDTGEIWLMEHKTAASINVGHLPLDDQAGSYWAVASKILQQEGILPKRMAIAGIMYNFMRKSPGDDRPKSELGYHNQPQKAHYVLALENHYGSDHGGPEELESLQLEKWKVADLKDLADKQGLTVYGDVSKVQPPPWFERYPVYRSQGERATMIERIKTEAFYKEGFINGDLPIYKTPGRECAWCPFQRMCQLDEQGDQQAVEEFKESQYHTRDPYAAHRFTQKSAE